LRRNAIVAIVVFLAALIAACNGNESEAPPAAPAPEEVRVPKSVTLFYESPSLVLMPETRSVDLPETPTIAAASVVSELFRGPDDETLTRLFPEDATVRAVYFLPNGLAVVDIGGPTLSAGWNTGSHTEEMAVYSLIQTLVSNFDAVRKVRIVVNGQPYPSLAGHIAIDRFLAPSPSLVGRR